MFVNAPATQVLRPSAGVIFIKTKKKKQTYCRKSASYSNLKINILPGDVDYI